MSKYWAVVLVLIATLIAAETLVVVSAREQKQGVPKTAARDDSQALKPNDVGAFMRLKLKYAQSVLEGIAVENFDQIAKNSQAIGLLTEDEMWRVYQTPEYRQHSGDFQRVAASLTKAARSKNLDGAALAYVQMTMSCVECHKYVRAAGVISKR